MLIPDEAADRDLERRVMHFFDTSHRPGLRRLAVHAQAGEVTISGRVGSFFERQLAVDHSRRMEGVVNLVDRIDVAGANHAN